MNVNAAVISNFARSLWSDLREKRLWPLALVLAVGIVAIPVLLSRSPGSTPAAAPLASGGTAAGAVPAVSVQDAAANAKLNGRGRDPFGQPGGAKSQAVAASQVPTSAGVTSGSAAASGGTGAAAGGGSVSGTSTAAPAQAVSGSAPAGGAPPPPLPAAKPAPAPTGLSSLETYRVAISMTNVSGGVNSTDPAQRLSALPSAQQPLVVELGVLQGGDRVLFAVAPGLVLRGPGECIPGPIDCEVLSIRTNQVESLSTGANSAPAAMFAVTGIATQSCGSAAAANVARRAVSVPGLALLRQWNPMAISLFSYQAGLGAVIDLRNLTVGGS